MGLLANTLRKVADVFERTHESLLSLDGSSMPSRDPLVVYDSGPQPDGSQKLVVMEPVHGGTTFVEIQPKNRK